ncbi:carboxymuconolactone decarboxylase family protein [Roseateles asaccharophilus]|uniref:AhpD family alkylhydroperoxidase n=1 Tax=Roseateles asaccharophilus TaxID=582607 RepID=A0ABU2AGK7_9BURK|nr:carboxymuconolactone decarboxylase family protein [Roseateles asaccharophilus]MDR7336125.1 AhpD family alkylhydroperoxidase [Roseateles asaccharophilus]
MSPFTVHTLETAPEASAPLLQQTLNAWGFIPKLHGTLAESPIALGAYNALFTAITTKGTLDAKEQQVAFQAVNVLHGCEYCTAGHTFLSRAAKVPESVIAALRDGEPIKDNARYEALRQFTEAVVRQRGRAGDDAVARFISAGFTRAQVLEVVTIVACKTISNYTNHLTHTPHEAFMADPMLKWVARPEMAAV